LAKRRGLRSQLKRKEQSTKCRGTAYGRSEPEGTRIQKRPGSRNDFEPRHVRKKKLYRRTSEKDKEELRAHSALLPLKKRGRIAKPIVRRTKGK